MRRPLVLLLVTLTVGACASVETPGEGPAPAQPTRPVEAPRPPEPEPEPEAVAEPPARAPDQWWLLDAEGAGVHGIGARRAYAELLAGRRPARTVVVAVIDGGIDTGHEDLDDNLWVNEDETPGNDVDDDGNGYADDVHGWNFIGGPDGRSVHHDTFEVTRLYAACTDGDAAGSLPVEPGEERCGEIESAYEAERAEIEGVRRQLRQMSAVVERVNRLLRSHLGVDSLTVEGVRAISTFRSDVRRARQLFLQLADNGITPAMIDDERQAVEDRIEYGLDPSFNPRPIVGDDYADASERRYGNSDVEGPDAGHGTHVAGIIGAERGNGLGTDGVAPAVRLMVVRAVPDGDERDKDVGNAIRYAVDNGADIINMSFGKAFSPRKEVVDAAVRHADEAGVLLVHAAGNDGADLANEPNFPSRYFEDGDSARSWIEVGASSWQGPERLAAPFSNYGRSEVHVFAPGMDIRSAAPDDGYETSSGTSMAAPVVSGLAALLMAYYPELDAGDVKRIILDSAARHAGQSVARPGDGTGRVPFGELSVTGGIVNAYEAVRLAEEIAGRR